MEGTPFWYGIRGGVISFFVRPEGVLVGVQGGLSRGDTKAVRALMPWSAFAQLAADVAKIQLQGADCAVSAD